MERDGGCIFCNIQWHMPKEPMPPTDIMHIVAKSQGGLGIEENGVLGCRYHHTLMDNGNEGVRGEMLAYIERYMKALYPDWDKKNLLYKKEWSE